MGMSADAQLCYGILFEEGFEFPWDSDKWDGDIEHWWLYEICGYENPFELYNDQGEYIDGKPPTEEINDKYYRAIHDFRETHPLLVEVVNYCSYDYPRHILAVADQVKLANREYAREITQEDLTNLASNLDILTQFCQKHSIETGEKPKLWLSSLPS